MTQSDALLLTLKRTLRAARGTPRCRTELEMSEANVQRLFATGSFSRSSKPCVA